MPPPLPYEVWSHIISYVEDFSTIQTALLVCKMWHSIVINPQYDEILQRAVHQSLNRHIYPTGKDHRDRYKLNKKAGPWYNAALRYKLIVHNLKSLNEPDCFALDTNGERVNLSCEEEAKNARTKLWEIPSDFGELALVAEYNRRAITPRSHLHFKSHSVVFSAQIDTSAGSQKICYPVINFAHRTINVKRRKVEGLFPDFELKEAGQLSEKSPVDVDGRKDRVWSFAGLGPSGTNDSHIHQRRLGLFEYVDLDRNDSLLARLSSSSDYSKYEIQIASPGHLEPHWSMKIPVDRLMPGIATILIASGMILVIERSFRVYSIKDRRMLLKCDSPRFGGRGNAIGCFAITQTHLLGLDQSEGYMYAISLDTVLKNQSADQGLWDRVFDFSSLFDEKERQQLSNSSFFFSDKRFYDDYVSVVWRNAFLLIDLFRNTVQFYYTSYDEDVISGFQTMRLSPRSLCHWMVDADGRVVYISQKYLSSITSAYNYLNISGPVSINSLDLSGAEAGGMTLPL